MRGDRFAHSQKVPFDQGRKIVPDWEKLPPVMVRRFLEWKHFCDTRWDDAYRVTVPVPVGTRVRVHTFTFEDRAHAVLCEQWWTELGYSPMLKIL